MKLERKRSTVPVLGIVVLALCVVTLPVSAEEAPKDTEKPQKASVFRKEQDGVLWFEQGTDGETKYSAAMALSAQSDDIVIVVSTSEKHLEKAVGLAVKMAKALQKRDDTPDHVPVVAFKSDRPTVGYRFYTDGLYYGVENLGVYGPAEAKKQLGKVITQHHLLKRHVKEGRWGKDHDTFKTLQILGN